jgi:hypothetical protein
MVFPLITGPPREAKPGTGRVIPGLNPGMTMRERF